MHNISSRPFDSVSKTVISVGHVEERVCALNIITHILAVELMSGFSTAAAHHVYSDGPGL